MNILIEQLPEAVEIEGQEYRINTDFRPCLRIILAYEDPELTAYEKQLILLNNLYPEVPVNVEAALQVGIRFLDGGKSESSEGLAPTLRVYSFGKDADFIFSAFKQTHQIDLADTQYLHWWKFLALFMDLGSETTFCNLVGLRKRIKTGKATKEELKAYREIRELVDLEEPERMTAEEEAREAEFIRLVEEGRKKRANQS